MRSGEILGLQIGDIDLNNEVISVSRSVSRGKVSTPKTANSFRNIQIFDLLKPYLLDQIKKAIEDNSLFLFSRNGKFIPSIDYVRGKRAYGQWTKLLESLNIPYRKIYNTRHTFITSMLKTGRLSALEIAQMVGYANTKIIFQNYARYIKDEHLKIDKKFDLYE